MNFDYTTMIEKSEKFKGELTDKNKVIISIITPVYNTKKYLDDTAKCILNQTFPYFEWLIIDDGSKDEESLKYVDRIASLDSRIKVIHKSNSGQADTRDFGVKNSSESSKYVLFIDDDDIIDLTYLECAYWTLETNKGASWAFTDVVHFDKFNALATTRFDPEKEKKENNIVVTALINKNDFISVGGFGLKEKGIYEDWNLWLKMIAKGMYPVRMNFFGFWYRRKESIESELAKSNENKARAKAIIDETASKIKRTNPSIEYPREVYNWDLLEDSVDSIVVPKYKNNGKTNILMMVPWTSMGGADKFNIDLVEGLDKDKYEVTVLFTEPQLNSWRDLIDKDAKAVYDLTTFIDRKYWIAFINYIIEKNNINLILNTNSTFGYSVLPYLKAKHNEISILDYIHMEEWYNRNGGFSRDSATVASVIDKTLVCNENSKKILVNHFGRKAEEIETVYIGVDEKKFDPELENKEALREKFEIPKNKKVVSFIARIDLQKRPILLMEILKNLAKKRQDYYVLIAGDGPMLTKIQKLAKKYKIENMIKFLGAVSNTREIYAVSDVTLNCSIKEGLALTAYESLSMGVPVVSSDVGGQAELINEEVGQIIKCYQEEKDVHVFEYSEEEISDYVVALEKVFDNLDYYKSNCRKRILNGFTINQMIVRMSEILENYAKNPNEEKIQNGKALANSIDVCKENCTKYFIAFKGEYNWLVKSFNDKLDTVAAKQYKKKIKKENYATVKDKIKNEGKRAVVYKAAEKMHLANEAILMMKLVDSLILLFKNTIGALIKAVFNLFKILFSIIAILIKFVILFFVRIINVFLKLFKKDPINLMFK